MRLDKYLKVSRIIKRRTVAKEACDGGRVSINGRVAKAGSEVEVGDKISIRFRGRPQGKRLRHVQGIGRGRSDEGGAGISPAPSPSQLPERRWYNEKLEGLCKPADSLHGL